MSTQLAQLLEESDLPFELNAELEPVLTALRELTPVTVPEPSPQLAALLARPPAPRARQPHTYRPRRTALAAVAAVMGSFTLTGVAAVADVLPDSAQQFVSDLSKHIGIELPAPQPEEPSETLEPRPADEEPAPAPVESDPPVLREATPEESPEKKTEEPSEEPTTEPGPSAPLSPTEPEPTPPAPEQPSEPPSPTLTEPPVGAEEPVESPTAEESGSAPPSPGEDSTERGFARENETPTASASPTPSPTPTGESVTSIAG